MDSSLPYWPDGLDTPLVDRKHQILPRSQVTRMESGRNRIRRLQLEPIEVVDVTWNFVADAYVTFRNFFINDLEHGSLFFVMETLEPSPLPGYSYLMTRSYAFLDGTYSFSESDNLFTVTATLEIDEEEQDYYPSRYVRSYVADAASSSATFHDGERLPEPEYVSTSAGFLSGLHFEAVVSIPNQADEGLASAGFQSGAHVLVVYTLTADESSSVSAGFLSGAYTLTISSTEQAESSSVSAGFQSGVYTLTAVAVPAQAETGSVSAGFQSGVYALA